MRRAFIICVAIAALAFVHAGARQSGATDFLGTWTGKWEAAGTGATGGFELTLEKGEADKIGGRVSVTGEPTYKAALKTVTFDGTKMTATYDFPPDPTIVIALEAKFDGNTANGTWSARQGGAQTEVASGTWTVKKQ